MTSLHLRTSDQSVEFAGGYILYLSFYTFSAYIWAIQTIASKAALEENNILSKKEVRHEYYFFKGVFRQDAH